MTFEEVLPHLRRGRGIKRKDWQGYWMLGYNAFGQETIMVFTKEGRILDTPEAQHILASDWEAHDVEDLVAQNIKSLAK